MKGSLIGSPVPKKAQSDHVAIRVLLSVRQARGDGYAPAHDSVRTHHPRRGCAQVHRPTATAAVARGETQDLGHEPEHGLLGFGGDVFDRWVPGAAGGGFDRLDQDLVMGPVATGDQVAWRKSRDCGGRDSLLTDTAVHGSPDTPLVGQPQHLALESPDEICVEKDAGSPRRSQCHQIRVFRLQAQAPSRPVDFFCLHSKTAPLLRQALQTSPPGTQPRLSVTEPCPR